MQHRFETDSLTTLTKCPKNIETQSTSRNNVLSIQQIQRPVVIAKWQKKAVNWNSAWPLKVNAIDEIFCVDTYAWLSHTICFQSDFPEIFYSEFQSTLPIPFRMWITPTYLVSNLFRKRWTWSFRNSTKCKDVHFSIIIKRKLYIILRYMYSVWHLVLPILCEIFRSTFLWVYDLNTTNTINTTTSNMSCCVRGIFQYVIFP